MALVVSSVLLLAACLNFASLLGNALEVAEEKDAASLPNPALRPFLEA
jgi:hypothetical protein